MTRRAILLGSVVEIVIGLQAGKVDVQRDKAAVYGRPGRK